MDPITQQSAVSMPADQEGLKEIDELFGSSEQDTQGQGLTSDEDNLSDTSASAPEEDFTNLNLEQLTRKLQSNLDKTKNELDKARQKLGKQEGLETLFHSIYSDPEVRHAFIAEIAPDLIKPADPYEVVAQQLRKEFGDDFIPDDDEAKKPLSTSWRYNRRVDELLRQAESKQNKLPSSLKELKELKAAEIAAAQEKHDKEKKDIMAKMKWDDNTWANFESWGKKFNLANLATVFNYTRTKGKTIVPNLAPLGGGSVSKGSMAELNKYFG